MRAFVLLCLIIGAAHADTAGYNYHPLPHTLGSLSLTLGAFPISNIIESASQVQAAASSKVPVVAVANFEKPVERPTAPYETDFYTYTAPESEAENAELSDGQPLTEFLSSQRVIFIKSPESDIYSVAAEQLAKKPELDIYVLSRQIDNEPFIEQLEKLQQPDVRKPLVQFIPYKNNADVRAAQQAIQAEVDALPGPTAIHNEGLAPTLDASSPIIFRIASRGGSGYETFESLDDVANPNGNYLPPQVS